MNNQVRRIYVEKRQGFDFEAQNLYQDLKKNLGIKNLERLRVVDRYDLSGISDEEYNRARSIIFSDPPVDMVYDEHLPLNNGARVFAMEYLPGQYHQQADFAAQGIQILTQKEVPTVLAAKVIILEGNISDSQFAKIKEYCINPVESREASLEKPRSLDLEAEVPADVEVLEGFIAKTPQQLEGFLKDYGLAMGLEDLLFCQQYFRDSEKRDPTITEIRLIDTYWSDHCRHTTFFTEIEDVAIEKARYTGPIEKAYGEYLASRDYVYGESPKDICLMDIALMGMKELKKKGLLNDLDESDEINACSIVVDVDVDGSREEWLVMFKNETHNHPTEIEPFGGAATCLGGAIRDPLSGRSYVYQAMRVTGSGDPRAKLEDTLPGKLPQRKITTEAAEGYSSYGNQIGVPAGQVAEVYHEGFIAKRMELGAVIAAAPKENVVRKAPAEGDVVILVGGRTGRDGCGGATGSSKEHTEESLTTCGADVQKGNPAVERYLQRLFRKPEVSKMIKKCNDFGAGGVSVAIGELADSVEINLDVIPQKYGGLDGTELAISESQERMAVVVAAAHAQEFIQQSRLENLEATVVARVTANGRLRMFWRNKAIVDLSREFLNTNGIKQRVKLTVAAPREEEPYFDVLPEGVAKELPDLHRAWLGNLQDLNVCSQRGLVERFDSTVGAATVLMPFGGRYQATPTEGMVAKLPVLSGETSTATVMTYGYNPQLASWSPFHGALYAVVEAVTKVVALGGDYRSVRLTLQEYFEKLGKDPVRWGKPFSALLGAFLAQKNLGIPAIGGKDSMSGTFEDLHVPPTLVAFAVNVVDAGQVVSQEFKSTDSQVVLLPVARDENLLPDFAALKKNFTKISELISTGKVLASHTVKVGGLAAAISKMSFGNGIGFRFANPVDVSRLFTADYGSVLLEIDRSLDLPQIFGDVEYQILGYTQKEPVISVNGIEISIEESLAHWESPLESIFPTKVPAVAEAKARAARYDGKNTKKPATAVAKPRVFIPVFPGTNGEFDCAPHFEKAGAVVDTMVIRNLSPAEVEYSVNEMVKRIGQAQIIMLPGDAGTFSVAMFRIPRVKEAVMDLLNKRDGLILGIGRGFQALLKLGLVPYGEIVDLTEESPALTDNIIGRHVSTMVQTKVVSNLSPWFNNVELGDVHTLALSGRQGRFVAKGQLIEKLMKNGQVATQYVDFDGLPSNDLRFNPTGSYDAIEGLTSPDGRVLGKMGHSERIGSRVAVNVPGEKDQKIFEAGVNYFR
ncbi:phosphoribosylformylglycinamidine synthase [Desulfofalx alkaliphila]|uniref:phosphoribosylformylglycinamidine synthase n=1 Tax=Desulfofalx alkaliphila TaxID=105483 RepID=UPI0004E23D07|nr:phosphoribosylformylglycinamidine synthase [Desulfofalx alkaliphila]